MKPSYFRWSHDANWHRTFVERIRESSRTTAVLRRVRKGTRFDLVLFREINPGGSARAHRSLAVFGHGAR